MGCPMPSLLSKIMYRVISLSNLNQRLKRELEQNTLDKHPKAVPSRHMIKEYHIKTQTIDNHIVYTLSSSVSKTKIGIFYIHGGAYVHGLSFMHFRLFKSIIKETNATIIVPDYPLVPHASTEDIYEFLKQSYKNTMFNYEHVIIMGDSAGGGLSLGLAQQLVIEGILHHHLMLLSPWLDVSMENDMIDTLQTKDPILNKQALIEVANMYARGRDLKDSMLSPLYGDLKGISSFNLWIGTNDILYADARALSRKCKDNDIKIDMHVYQDMLHTWMFFGLKESNAMINEMTKLINDSFN